MKYIKKFENFSEPVQEKITDFFKSREEIANGLLVALSKDTEKALNAIIPYYDDFVDTYFGVSGSEIPRHEDGRLGLGSQRLIDIVSFVPHFAGTKEAPGIFIKDEDGDTIVDKSKLSLASKITKNEILNLLSPHEDFSLNKLNPFRGLIDGIDKGPLKPLANTTTSGLDSSDIKLIDPSHFGIKQIKK